MEETIPEGPLVERGLDSSECEKTEGVVYPRQRVGLSPTMIPPFSEENGSSVCPAAQCMQACPCRMSSRRHFQRRGIIRLPCYGTGTGTTKVGPKDRGEYHLHTKTPFIGTAFYAAFFCRLIGYRMASSAAICSGVVAQQVAKRTTVRPSGSCSQRLNTACWLILSSCSGDRIINCWLVGESIKKG